MRYVALLLAFTVMASMSVAQDLKKVIPVASGKNLVEEATYWLPQVDELGSTVDTGSALVQKGVVAAKFMMVKQPSPQQWPYVELMCGLGRGLHQQDTLEISYKSDKQLLLKLVQSDLSDAGNETYAYYEMVLHSSPKSWSVARVLIENFTQPAWAPEEAMFVPLRPENVAEIQIVPQIDEAVGGTGSIKINRLVIFEGTH